jgi:hypothetical protein
VIVIPSKNFGKVGPRTVVDKEKERKKKSLTSGGYVHACVT